MPVFKREIAEKNIYSQIQKRYGLIGDSQPMQEAMLRIMQAAPTDLTVLITGTTGTGKEVVAHTLHSLSRRKKYPFVSVNCGAIPETLLESELFGHEKGAFTGAVEQRKGFFESADHGTIFLDEIGEMPVSTQVKLLRVLESGEFSRLGSSAVHKVDARVLAATNRDLELEVRDGNFRQDLFFRLKSVHIYLPTLRQRRDDIPELVEFFGVQICTKNGTIFEGASDDALEMLKALPWPGNIRELKNMVETMLTLEQATYITADMLSSYVPAALPAHRFEPVNDNQALVPPQRQSAPQNFEMELLLRTLIDMKKDIDDVKSKVYNISSDVEVLRQDVDNRHYAVVEDDPTAINEDNLNIAHMEQRLILAALRRFDGNRRLAAKALGISERTLYRKLSDYGMDD